MSTTRSSWERTSSAGSSRDEERLRAAVAEVHEVTVPVVCAVLTGVAALAPLPGVASHIGTIMRVIPFGLIGAISGHLAMGMDLAILVAVCLSFGVLFATFITLVLVPALYVILEDFGQAVQLILARGSRVSDLATGVIDT